MSEFDPGILVCELPVGFGVVFVTAVPPCGDLRDESCLIWDTPGQILGSQHPEFGLRHIEPTSMLRRVAPLEPFRETPRLGRRECCAQRCHGMGIEIVLNQNDLAGIRKMPVRQVFQDRRVIGGGAAVSDLDMPPAGRRRTICRYTGVPSNTPGRRSPKRPARISRGHGRVHIPIHRPDRAQ
jgi:hypothetical protein